MIGRSEVSVVLDEVESPPPEHLECDVMDQSITLCGNLTRNVDYSEKGVPRARFRVAHNSRRLDSATNEWKDTETLFIDVVCWRALATNTATSVRRGDSVMVTGRLRDSTWTDDKGVVHPQVEIDADVVAVDLRRGAALKVPKVSRDAETSPDFEMPAPPEPADDGELLDSDRAPELVGAGVEPPF